MIRKLKALIKYLKWLDTGSKDDQSLIISEKDKIKHLDKLVKKSTMLNTLKKVSPRKEFVDSSRDRIFEQIMETQRGQSTHRVASSKRRVYRRTFVASPAFTIILLLVLGFGFVGSVQASDNASPGDFLYSLDLAIEDVRLMFALNDVDRVQLLTQFAAERLQEAKTKYTQGDIVNAELALVNFEQQMNAIRTIIIEAEDSIQTELIQIAAYNNAANTEVLQTLINNNTSQNSLSTLMHALSVSDHTLVDISALPQAADVEDLPTSTLKFAADDLVDKEFPGSITPTDTDKPSPDSSNDGYLPPGHEDNPGQEDKDLPPGLEDKPKPPGLEDKDKDKKKN